MSEAASTTDAERHAGSARVGPCPQVWPRHLGPTDVSCDRARRWWPYQPPGLLRSPRVVLRTWPCLPGGVAGAEAQWATGYLSACKRRCAHMPGPGIEPGCPCGHKILSSCTSVCSDLQVRGQACAPSAFAFQGAPMPCRQSQPIAAPFTRAFRLSKSPAGANWARRALLWIASPPNSTGCRNSIGVL
jgi:hypothetical protein